MKKHLLSLFTVSFLLCASRSFSQNWLLGGQNITTATGILGTNNNKPVVFETNNTERGRIQNTSGFWGFGINAPAAQVHINATLAENNPLRVDVLNNPVLTLNKTGNLGLGVSEAAARLHLKSDFEKPAMVIESGGFISLIAGKGGMGIGRGASIPPEDGLFVKGNVGLGTSLPELKLQILGGSDASLNGGGYIMNGSFSSNNLVMDDNEIMARSNGAPSGLSLNNNGGNVIIDGTNSGSRLALGTSSPSTDVHFVHDLGSGASNGLRLKNAGFNNEDWTFYIQNGNGILELYANNALMGTFDDVSGKYSSLSDLKRKKDIEQSPDIMDKVLRLGVKKYRFLENKSTDVKYYGLIAQDVAKIFPEVVQHYKSDNGEEHFTMDYSSFGVLAIKAIQEQQNTITALEARIEKLEALIGKNGSLSVNGMKAESGIPVLNQNEPNPVTQNTTIQYKIPGGAQAYLHIYDASGNAVRKFQVKYSGKLQLNAADFKAGVYTYTLTVNGKIVASKKMLIGK